MIVDVKLVIVPYRLILDLSSGSVGTIGWAITSKIFIPKVFLFKS